MTKYLLLFLLLSCGPSPLVGTWTNRLSSTLSCSDGSGGSSSGVQTWIIGSTAGGLSAEVRGAGGVLVLCSPYFMREAGDGAVVSTKTCPPFVTGGVQFTPAITAGSVSFLHTAPESLSESLQFTLTGGNGVRCVAQEAGSLTH